MLYHWFTFPVLGFLSVSPWLLCSQDLRVFIHLVRVLDLTHLTRHQGYLMEPVLPGLLQLDHMVPYKDSFHLRQKPKTEIWSCDKDVTCFLEVMWKVLKRPTESLRQPRQALGSEWARNQEWKTGIWPPISEVQNACPELPEGTKPWCHFSEPTKTTWLCHLVSVNSDLQNWEIEGGCCFKSVYLRLFITPITESLHPDI